MKLNKAYPVVVDMLACWPAGGLFYVVDRASDTRSKKVLGVKFATGDDEG